MMIFRREIAGRIVAMIVAAILVIVLIGFGVSQCQKRQSQASQSRVDKGQAGAASESARDAIGTVTDAGRRETASEGLTRANERDIRAAEGAGDRVAPGVAGAGRAALCKRVAYQNDPRCKPNEPR